MQSESLQLEADSDFDYYGSVVLASAEVSRLNRTERKALFINSYNYFAIKSVLDRRCLGGKLCASIKDTKWVRGLNRG